jgi:amidase
MRPQSKSDEPSNRREFLIQSMRGGLALSILPYFGRGEADGREYEPLPQDTTGLEEATIAELQAKMQSGEMTSRGLAERYLSRIETVDKDGPALNSIIELNPDALSIAEDLDRERGGGRVRGPLHGIPVLIKDNIDTADRMMTTAGSLALVGSRPPADAFLVRRLRSSGAVILGKTNLSEWANIRSTRSTSGWSGRGGLTRNPYALDRNTSGSSSGSGAAVAANLCAVAVGTETDGSIVSPSSINGIVGIKPTVGLVSRTGVIPISHTQDTPGPMARTVRDAATLLGVLAGADGEDPATARARKHIAADYTTYLHEDGLRGARIGVARKYFGFHDRVDDLMREAIEAMKAHGATIVDPVEMKSFDALGNAEDTVLMYELKSDMAGYLARLGPAAPVKSLKEIIAFNERERESEMPYFGQELFLKAESKGTLKDREYLEAAEKCRTLAGKEGIDAAILRHKLDALIAPTDSPAWLTDLVDGDHFLGGSSTAAAVAGYPSVTVPAGLIFGLPVGISFFGRAWSEPTLVRLAYAFEQATHHRQKPRFLPTVELARGKEVR